MWYHGGMALTDKQHHAITLLVSGRNYRQTCKVLGITRATLWDWRKRDEFTEALEEARSQVQQEAHQQLHDLMARAVEVLGEGLDSESEAMRVKVALNVLDRLGLGPHSFEHSSETHTLDLEGVDDDVVMAIQGAALAKGNLA